MENRALTAIRAEIRNRWESIRTDAARLAPNVADSELPAVPVILGESLKVQKGEKYGVLTAILYLSPATESGRNLCPWATAGCAGACLGHSAGRLTMTPARNARLWKTGLFLAARGLFLELLRAEIRTHRRRASRKGLIPAVRLDGSTDLGLATMLAPEFPDVEFYDYTKSLKRALQGAAGRFGANYSVTFSHSGENLTACLDVLRAGGNVAVVFGTRSVDAMPATWHGFPVLNGDESDIRFGDPAGTVVGLTFKGNTAMDAAGSFVQPVACRGSVPRSA